MITGHTRLTQIPYDQQGWPNRPPCQAELARAGSMFALRHTQWPTGGARLSQSEKVSDTVNIAGGRVVAVLAGGAGELDTSV